MPSVWSGTLTSHIWAWSVVCTVLQQPVLLLWFRIGVPRVLGALRWAILHRVVVELKALALWSHLSLVSTSTVGCCGDEREAWIKPNSVLGKCPSLWNGGNHPQCTKSESLPDMSKAFIFNNSWTVLCVTGNVAGARSTTFPPLWGISHANTLCGSDLYFLSGIQQLPHASPLEI